MQNRRVCFTNKRLITLYYHTFIEKIFECHMGPSLQVVKFECSNIFHIENVKIYLYLFLR
jgi:hypothetical protein